MIRTGRTAALRRALALGVGLALASTAAACGSLPEPDLGSFPTSSLPPQDQNNSSVDPATAQNPLAQGQTDALPPRPSDYVPSILAVTDNGVAWLERRRSSGVDQVGTARPLALGSPLGSDAPGSGNDDAGTQSDSGQDDSDTGDDFAEDGGGDAQGGRVASSGGDAPVLVARDDLFGGIVTQGPDRELTWFPGTGGEARTIAVEERDLLDIGYSAGTPEALTERNGQIMRTRLVDNESTVFAAVEAGERVLDISSAGGVVAVAVGDADCGAVRFYSSEGVNLGIQPFGTLLCGEAARPTVGSVGMSPDGEAVAYTVITYREDGVERRTELRAVELASGASILSVEVGGSGDAIDSVSFDGVSAVMLRRSSSGSEVVLVDSGEPRTLDLSGIGTVRSVAFTRLPLSAGFLTPLPEPAAAETTTADDADDADNAEGDDDS